MRRCVLSLLSGTLLIGSLCPKLRAADEVQKQLKAEYESKVLTLRQPYSGEQLRFGADGKLIGDAKLGAWTVDGRLEVKNVSLANRVLKIKARRVRLFFDPFRQQFRDLQSVHKGERAAILFKNIRNRQLWKEVTEQQVEIDVELASESPGYQEISLERLTKWSWVAAHPQGGESGRVVTFVVSRNSAATVCDFLGKPLHINWSWFTYFTR